MAAATNFHFGASLIRPLNNMCQVINRAFQLNYHGSRKKKKEKRKKNQGFKNAGGGLKRINN